MHIMRGQILCVCVWWWYVVVVVVGGGGVSGVSEIPKWWMGKVIETVSRVWRDHDGSVALEAE